METRKHQARVRRLVLRAAPVIATRRGDRWRPRQRSRARPPGRGAPPSPSTHRILQRLAAVLALALFAGFVVSGTAAADAPSPVSPSSAQTLVGAASGTPVSASVTIKPAGGFPNAAENPLPAVGTNTPFVCYDTGWNDLGT